MLQDVTVRFEEGGGDYDHSQINDINIVITTNNDKRYLLVFRPSATVANENLNCC